MQGPVVIIGAGQAGVQAAESLRSGGFAGSITLLGDEPGGPYHRPPLSKAWLAGEMDAAQLTLRAPEALARKNIELRTGVRVTAIDRDRRQVVLANGATLPYEGLVLATGARLRKLPVPGGDLPGVLGLRSRADAQAIAERLVQCESNGWPVVVVGGGFIGLEVAATARKKNLAVTVVESAPRLLGRVLPPMLSDWYAQLHRGQGVNLLLQAGLESIRANPAGTPLSLWLKDGTELPAGLVVVGIGVEANDELAQAAGLECDRGIVVDACSRTSDPAIVATGDCTVRRLDDGSLQRLESVQNAVEQGKSAAAALLGQPRPFTAAPWFWSDQYQVKLQMAGLSAGSDRQVLRGSLEGDSFSIYHYRGGRLVGVDSINASREHLQARKLLDGGCSPTVEQAGDPQFDLASLLKTPI